ncbi:MAG: insulinase family protein [Saprospiraceae bacterium]|nr:insulinase family protein [Saprospiraceae bacterium]
MKHISFLFTLTLILILGCTPKTATTIEAPQAPTEEVVHTSDEPKSMPAEETRTELGGAVAKKMEKAAQTPTDPMMQSVPLDPRVITGKLDNGLTYYIQKNEKPEERAEIRLAVRAGSINEDDDQKGLAHFVEHMAFNGTMHFEKSELIDYLQSVGTRFGADLNAYTSFDETVYMLQVRTDSQAIFDKGMLILEDWANAVTFEDEEIDKERGVVLSELRSGLSAQERMRNQYLPTLLHGSKYADRLPIGTKEILSGAPYDALKRFYRDWYRPDLMSVVVVGDVDVEEVEKDIKERFGQIANPDDEREREKYGFPDHEQTLVSITKDKEANFTTAQVMYKHPHKPVKDLKDYRTSLVRNTYNRMLNNRLNELRQAADPPFLYGYSGYGRFVGNLDTYTAYVTSGEGEVMKGLASVLTENKRVLEHGFTASELDRTRIEMISEAETTAKEEDKTQSGTLAMQYVYNFLNENPVPSPTQRFQLAQALLPTISLEEVNALAKSWITDGENRVIIVTGPDKEDVPLPAEEDILDLLKEVDMKSVEPYEDEVANVPLLGEDPDAGKVVDTKTLDDLAVTEWVLSNGVQVILKPSDFQNDEIRFNAFSPGGHSIYPDEDYRSASLASAILNQSGIADFDQIQLQKMMAGKQLNVSPYISELEEGMSGFSTIKDLETMFQLIYMYFTDPRKDPEAYQSIISRQKQILQNYLVDPRNYYREKVSEIKYGDHKRRGVPTAEELDEASLDKIMEVYNDRFADASDFSFVFVGNFTLDSIRPLVEKYIGSLPNIEREEDWKDVGAHVAEGKHIERFSYGAAPKTQVEMSWSGEMDWDVEADRRKHNMLMEVLRNKLRESMREDKGGVYGVGVRGNVSKIPKEGQSVSLSFNADPDRVDELIQTALDDIQKIKNGGVSEEDLQKVREILKQSRIKNLKENRYWANALKSLYSYDLDPNMILLENYLPVIEQISPEDIVDMAKRTFNPENYIEVVMMPAADANGK